MVSFYSFWNGVRLLVTLYNAVMVPFRCSFMFHLAHPAVLCKFHQCIAYSEWSRLLLLQSLTTLAMRCSG